MQCSIWLYHFSNDTLHGTIHCVNISQLSHAPVSVGIQVFAAFGYNAAVDVLTHVSWCLCLRVLG